MGIIVDNSVSRKFQFESPVGHASRSSLPRGSGAVEAP
jgi:hypothetical protein